MRLSTCLAALCLVLGGIGCRASETMGGDAAIDASALGAPDFRGPVLAVEETPRRFLIQYRSEGVNSGRIWFGLLEGTRIRRPNGARVAAADIRPGAVLSVWTSHPILESDPAQGVADSIVAEAAR
jgi:hypothetical protein